MASNVKEVEVGKENEKTNSDTVEPRQFDVVVTDSMEENPDESVTCSPAANTNQDGPSSPQKNESTHTDNNADNDAPSEQTETTGESETSDAKPSTSCEEVVEKTKSSKYRRNEDVDDEETSMDSIRWLGAVSVEGGSVTEEVDLSQLSYSSSSTPSSSSDSQHDYETTFRAKKRPSNASSDAEEEKLINMQMAKDKPKHKWFVVQEVVNRQMGMSSRYQSIDLFQQHCYSSLHAVQRLELMYKLDNHDGCVNTLHFNSCGSLLASGSDDLSIVLWDWACGRPAVKYKSGHKSNVFQAKFLPLAGDTHIVSCSRDGQVRLAEMSSEGVCRSTRKLAAHCGAVHKLAVQTETPHVFLSCAEDAQVFSIDVREDTPNKILCVKDDQRKIPLYGIHSNPMNNNEFCVNGRSNFIHIYDKRMVEGNKLTAPLKKFCPHHLMFAKSSTQVTCAIFSYDGQEIIGSYNDEDIYLFDTTTSCKTNYKYKYEGHRNNMTVKGVNFFGPKSEYIVSGSDCGNIYFWDKPTQAVVQWMPGDEGGVVNCLEPHPHLPCIATSGLDSDVKIWVPSNEHEPTLDGLREAMLDNYKSRESDRQPRPYSAGHANLILQWRRHERRVAQRRRAEQGDNASPPSSDDASDEDDPPFQQCSPS